MTHSKAEKLRVNNTCTVCGTFISGNKIKRHIKYYHGTKCLEEHIANIKRLRAKKPGKLAKKVDGRAVVPIDTNYRQKTTKSMENRVKIDASVEGRPQMNAKLDNEMNDLLPEDPELANKN